MDMSIILTPKLLDLRERFHANGFDLRFVGGCVRDILIGVLPKDIDLHTDATPSECKLIYNNANIKFIETGLSHGTMSVVLDGITYEITSLRRDVSTDGRHAEVSYTRDWLVDASRRDFTINSMSMNFEGDIFDPYNGQQDLQNGIVRFVGDARSRIQEDYLRILRWFRFRGRFEKTSSQVDSYARSAVLYNATGLTRVSYERIWSEISKILVGPRALDMMYDIQRTGVYAPIELYCDLHTNMQNLYGYFVNNQNIHIHSNTKNPVTMMVALYSRRASDILTRWKSSHQEQKLATWLIDNVQKDHSLTRLLAVDNVSSKWVRELGVLRGLDAFELAVIESWDPPLFPVTGYDLIRKGIKPGSMYTIILKGLKNAWADSGYTLTKDQLLAMIND
jgi:tRNA nucleotidyltransferase (CCA-adding enzyme)